MAEIPKRSWHLALGACVALLLSAGAGCQSTAPTIPQGVLSTIHQKALALSTDRAIEQAGMTVEELGGHTVYIDVKEPESDANLAKHHVRTRVIERLSDMSGQVAQTPGASQKQVACVIDLAGVDITDGGFLFSDWITTKAEVHLRFNIDGPEGHAERQGTGIAHYEQSWFLGIGPSEELK